MLVATSPDLRTYEEIGLLELDEAGGVNQPTAIYDSAAETYRLSWTTDAGAVRHQSFSDLVAAVEQGEQGSAATGAVTGTVTGSGEMIVTVPVIFSENTKLRPVSLLMKLTNTGRSTSSKWILTLPSWSSAGLGGSTAAAGPARSPAAAAAGRRPIRP